MISVNDRAVIRDLAIRYAELSSSESNRNALALWRDLNNLRSKRPLPSLMISEHLNEQALRQQFRDGFEKLRGCQVELHIHDLMTVSGDIARIFRWAQIAREEAGRAAG